MYQNGHNAMLNDEAMISKNSLVLSELEDEKNAFEKNKRNYRNRNKA